MKKLLLFLFVIVNCIAIAQPPLKMTYQVVVRDANNELVVNQPVGVQVTIVEDNPNGPMVYRETHTVVTNANALATLIIGMGVHPYPYTLDGVKWGEHDHYLQIDIDPTGGINYTITGTQQLLSVPYAFYSNQAKYVDTALHAINAIYSDSTYYAYNSLYSHYTDSAWAAISAGYANYSDTSGYAADAYHSIYADTALFLMNAQNSDTSKFAWHSDTSNYAYNAGNATNAVNATYSDTALYSYNANTANSATNATNAVNATYSDTALYSYNANTANSATNATNAVNATYSDTALYSYNANTANSATNATNAVNATYSDTALYATHALYSDSSDYNHLANRPTGTNKGDMLYWETSDNSWHVTPAGNMGEILQMDTSNVPTWNTVAGVSYNLPTVVTNGISNFTGDEATANGQVTYDGGTPFVVSGFCWSTNANPTISDSYSMDGIGTTSFSHLITGLNLGTTYHVRAFAMNNGGIAYGSDVSFTTWDYPTVVTNSTVTTISATTAYCGGTVTSDGGNYVNQRGICYSSWNSTPDIFNNDGMTYDGSGTGAFSSFMNGLQQGVTYYVCAYATNDIGTVYGNTITFTTLRTPVLTTNSVTDIDTMSAVSGGNITSDGGDPVTGRGIVWNTGGYPTITNYLGITYNGTGIGSFTDTMKNLTPGQTYYVRAYATNGIGTNYGQQYSFKALPIKPTVTTNAISYWNVYDANGGGNVTSDGGAYVSQRGLCWNTTGSPTLADNYNTHYNGGTGNYSLNISGLQPGTTYYVRAYATNSAGTSYGNEVTFTTNATLPSVTTNPVSDTTATSAVSGGNVTSDGGDSVTARGIVWFEESMYYNYWDCPTINNYQGITTNGSGIGSFVDTMKNFTPGYYYYVRAYATNSIGTNYGTCYYFRAKTTVPTVATSATVTNIMGTSAVCGGTVTNNGGEYVSSRGVCWNTTGNPTLADNSAQQGSGNGTFTITITGLTDSTTYWVCAYATNSNGTSYGTAISFTTPKLPTVTTDTVSGIGTTWAYSGVNVIDGAGEIITACGVCWSTSPTPTVSNAKTVDGAGVAPLSYPSLCQNLMDGTTYYVRAYATTSAGTGYGQTYSFTTLSFQPCPGVATVSDTDGNVYNTIQIGTQCWMRENLRTTRFPDGTNIPDGSITSTTVPFKFYPGGSSSYVQTHGYLYNWAAVMNGSSSSAANPSGVQGICPKGWHVPSNLEWTLMSNYVTTQASCQCGGSSTAIAKALANQTGWYSNTSNCTPGNSNSVISNNITGFSAMPAGYNSSGNYGNSTGRGNYAHYWSCTESNTNTSYMLAIYYYSDGIGQYAENKYYGMSVRCIKDNSSIADGQPCPGAATVTDNDNNTYNTVQIGSQCWMKENLRTTKYPDGTSIAYGQGQSTSTTTGYYYHPNNNSGNDVTYGLLYNWNAAMNAGSASSSVPSGVQGICPAGWHLPSRSEWNILYNYVKSGQYLCNNTAYSGKALASNANWNSSANTCVVGNDLSANNATGFSLQPAGYRSNTYYYDFNSAANLWSTEEYTSDPIRAYYCYLTSTATDLYTNNSYYKYNAASIRCIKD